MEFAILFLQHEPGPIDPHRIALFFGFVFLFLAGVADAVTTHVGISRGLYELNPFVRWLMQRGGPNMWVIVKLAATAILGLVLFQQGLLLSLYIVAAITFAVAVRNYYLIQR